MNLKVLIVEDQASHALSISRCLSEAGHQVLGVARDGLEACAMRRELDPDLVVMDIFLPKMNGIEAARAMNESEPLPVVLITGQVDPRFLAGAQDAGVYSYLAKPVESAILGPALELAFKNFRRVVKWEKKIIDLRGGLVEHRLLEHAKGILIDRHGISDAQAGQMLEQAADAPGLSMAQTAQKIIDG